MVYALYTYWLIRLRYSKNNMNKYKAQYELTPFDCYWFLTEMLSKCLKESQRFHIAKYTLILIIIQLYV